MNNHAEMVNVTDILELAASFVRVNPKVRQKFLLLLQSGFSEALEIFTILHGAVFVRLYSDWQLS
jgi:hypothetical protein